MPLHKARLFSNTFWLTDDLIAIKDRLELDKNLYNKNIYPSELLLSCRKLF